MKPYQVSRIRNVCLLSHGGAGKTTLCESMLYLSGGIDRMGRISDGSTVSDFDSEETKRKVSISTSIVPVEWHETKINLIDTPGYFDFVGEVVQGVRAADAAVIVVSGRSGVSVGAENSWKYANNLKLPRMIFINKLDDERANYSKVVDQLRQHFGKKIVPFTSPIKEGDSVCGFVDIIEMSAKRYAERGEVTSMTMPSDIVSQIMPMREMIFEAVAETSETLMEKYFAGQDFSATEIKLALQQGVKSGDIVPVFCGSSARCEGVTPLIDAIVEYLPAPNETLNVMATNVSTGEPVLIDCSDTQPFSALVFKTVADPYVGRMSYFKVFSGSISSDSTVYNSSTEETEKIGRVCFVRGKKQLEADKISAGDIGVITKLAKTYTGNTLCSKSRIVKFEQISFPKPSLSLSVLPKTKGDEEKISSGLHKLLEEDLTFSLQNNIETHQQIISGVGEQHLDVVVSKLRTKFGVAVELEEPRVAYRETIRKKIKVEGKHKKQSGGHGQYGHVWVEFEPGDSEDLVFEENVFGGAVPKNFFPAVEKGLQDCIAHGVLAGYPVVNLKATLVDGSYHPVDSSEMAFKMAATIAYKKGLEGASPVLLEPIGRLEVTVPDNFMGDVIGDINKRRGKIVGMSPDAEGAQKVVADVPMSEMHKYSTDLRSMTQSRGSFTLEFLKYEEAIPSVSQKVIETSKLLQMA